jgi:hypothetical protein
MRSLEGGAGMAEERETICSTRISTGRTTYFLDTRQAVNGRYYLTVTESRRNPDGSFDQKRLMVFEEVLADFSSAIRSMADRTGELISSRTDSEIDDLRKLHPRAFMKWNEEEEEKLIALFSSGNAPADIGESLGRSLQAVTARLEKLGLVPAPASEGQAI